MSVFVISYDLRKPDFDYDDLYTELDALGAKHIQDSVWAVRTSLSSGKVFDALWAHMHMSEIDCLLYPSIKTRAIKPKIQ